MLESGRKDKGADVQDYLELFISNLQVQRPDPRVMRKIRMNFSSQLIVAAKSRTAAQDLYDTVKQLPMTLTVAVIKEAEGITVNGPYDADRPYLLTASDFTGKQLMVKLLKVQRDLVGVKDSEQEAALKHEDDMVKILGLANPSVNFVPMRRTTITIPSDPQVVKMVSTAPGNFTALIMPRFITTVARAPLFSHQALADGAVTMIYALEYMHALHIAHLDVKGDNVFVSQEGVWHLGDFGSSRYFKSAVVTTSSSFYPHRIVGEEAHARFDWYMLCVMLCLASVDVHADLTVMFGSPVRDNLVRDYVEHLAGCEKSKALANVMAELLARHDSA
jgi:hypothetical protein